MNFGPFALGWFPASKSGSHLKAAENLKRSEVLDAVLDSFHGGSAWREPLAWREAADQQPRGLDRLLSGWRRGPA